MPWDIRKGYGRCGPDQYAVRNTQTGRVMGCHDTPDGAGRQLAALKHNVTEGSGMGATATETATPADVAAAITRRRGGQAEAEMTTGSINDLPDSAFAYIEPGGTKDEQGKTVPRSKRHFPIHDKAHVQNALARASQSPFGAKAMGKIRAAARRLGVKVSDSESRRRRVFTEHITLVEAAVGGPSTGRRMEIQLISPGWGSSGFYSESVLKDAAKRKVFPAGTAMYVDHQTISEAGDRVHGERSLKDMAGRFVTDARWDGKALVAEVAVTNPVYRPILSEMRDDVGVSIRSYGQAELGAAQGREGLIVKSIDEAQSVDFVAEAGRGGKVLALLESARAQMDTNPEVAVHAQFEAALAAYQEWRRGRDGEEFAEARNVGQWLEAQMHASATSMLDHMYGEGRLTRDERIALSDGLGEALKAFVKSVEGSNPQLYKRDLWQDADGGGDMAESADDQAAASDDQASQAGDQGAGDEPPADDAGDDDTAPDAGADTGDTETSGAANAGEHDDTPEGEPTRDDAAAQNEDSPRPDEGEPMGQDTTDTTEAVRSTPGSARQIMERELAEHRRRADLAEAREAARELIADATRDAWLTPLAIQRVTRELLESLPLTQDGLLDEDELTKRATRLVDQAESEATQMLEAAGMGRPRDLGGGGALVESGGRASGGGYRTRAAVEDELGKRLDSAFADLDLNEAARKVAVRGRE